jgi:hypothetical protein
MCPPSVPVFFAERDHNERCGDSGKPKKCRGLLNPGAVRCDLASGLSS